jgi:hypothetical protein
MRLGSSLLLEACLGGDEVVDLVDLEREVEEPDRTWAVVGCALADPEQRQVVVVL